MIKSKLRHSKLEGEIRLTRHASGAFGTGFARCDLRTLGRVQILRISPPHSPI